ncbi:hypothetical protein E3N88_09042 [Mikania micrantha]|uniref:Uncharacterized protein n=1 Tax=Mikania micrantha TaxID=192012 RepID=A0A5N6PK88_9ASTR|nr:hypothetical protein E3N88_09042 [Mikania micrantha]
MASIQIFKSGLFPFSASQSSSRRKERLICNDTKRILKFRGKSGHEKIISLQASMVLVMLFGAKDKMPRPRATMSGNKCLPQGRVLPSSKESILGQWELLIHKLRMIHPNGSGPGRGCIALRSNTESIPFLAVAHFSFAAFHFHSAVGEEPTESLFMKELKRRGMTPTSLLEESWSTLKDENITYKEEDGGFSNRNIVSTDLEKALTNQREQSMALNSEGLEGLIPRAKVLLTLGGTYFLAFWPLILVTVASFSAVYIYFGPKFVHDATTRQVYLPQYVDPYALLEEQRISETAPRLN